nr:hypothetical protein [Gemmatimonadales bacterium]
DHGSEPGGVRRLAVLPFENQGAASDDYFADGLTEEVRSKLTAIHGLQVTATNSSEQYRKSGKSLAQIASELGVDYLLVGKVRWEKRADGTSRVRVSPELIEVASGAAKWHEPFDAALTDVFQVQSEIASQVASKLDVALTDSVKTGLEARPTQNVAAYDAYLRGGGPGADPAALRAHIALLEQAVALDPSFAKAWARLATSYLALYSNSVPTREIARSARHAADRAITLAPGDAAGYFALANYFRGANPQPDSAQAAFETAFRLAPDDLNALAMRATLDASRGAWDSALVRTDAVLARDPRVARRWGFKAQLLTRLHRYPQARAALDRGLQFAPGDLQMTEYRVLVELMAGDLPAAQAVLRRPGANPAALAAYMATYNDLYWALPEADQDLVLRLGPASFDNDRATWATVRAQIYAMRGDAAHTRIYADSALAGYDEQLRDAPNDAQLHVLRGLMLAYLGRKPEAIAEGQRATAILPRTASAISGAYVEHQLARIYIITGEQDKAIDTIDGLMKWGTLLSPGYLRLDPGFAPLRNNPKFQALAKG